MYLNCKTYFSFRYGTFSTRQLVDSALDNGISAMALTNINSTCDIWDFVQYCHAAGIKPIPGVEVRNGDELLYILLAATKKGLRWINEFLSFHLLKALNFPLSTDDTSFFDDSWDGFVIFPLGTKSPEKLLQNERIGILPRELAKLFGTDIKLHADKFVVRQPVTVQNETYHSLHRLLRAIDKNTLLSKLPAETEASKDEVFVSPSYLLEKFRQFPFIITNTYKLIDACNINIDFHSDKNKKILQRNSG